MHGSELSYVSSELFCKFRNLSWASLNFCSVLRSPVPPVARLWRASNLLKIEPDSKIPRYFATFVYFRTLPLHWGLCWTLQKFHDTPCHAPDPMVRFPENYKHVIPVPKSTRRASDVASILSLSLPPPTIIYVTIRSCFTNYARRILWARGAVLMVSTHKIAAVQGELFFYPSQCIRENIPLKESTFQKVL
jgi:hypothetical protein